MPRRPNPVPTYRLHKQSGQAIVTLPDGAGGRRDVLLGKYDTAESRAEYARVVAEWSANGRRPPVPAAGADLTLNELALAFWRHAERHYRRPDGTPTNELAEYRLCLRALRQLYGHTEAAGFGPLALKAVRQRMVDDGLCRGVVNQRVGRIVRTFKWAVSEELVPESVHAALRTVAGLARGRTAARETEPVKPVADRVVDATLPFLSPPLRAAVQVQRLTGARPGEVLSMRAADITMTGELWEYRPAQHKTAWRGRGRVIVLGPKAQAVVKPLLTLDVQAHLFSPAAGRAAWAAEARTRRRTKLFPCDRRRAGRRTKDPARRPGGRYAVATYGVAVRRACDRADHAARQEAENALAAAEGRDPADVPAVVGDSDRIIPRWHPNQLRHSHGTEVRRRFGLEAAGAALGHAKMSATEIYAERDETLARRVAAEVG